MVFENHECLMDIDDQLFGMSSYYKYFIQIKKYKGHDPNLWFSGITFFSGLALCSLQIKKRSLMGCLFFDADFSTFFHFGR